MTNCRPITAHLGLVELHPVLGDAGLDDLAQLGLVDHAVAVGVVHLEQEGELLLLALTNER